jgi:hypothetical protein
LKARVQISDNFWRNVFAFTSTIYLIVGEE